MNCRRVLAIACCFASLAGCGGGSGAGSGIGPSNTPSSGNGASITAHFSFAIPAQATTSSAARRAAYISPSSRSLEIDVAYGTASTVGAQLNLAPLPPSCTVSDGVTQCDLAVVAQASATDFIITFYDQLNEQGNVLSTATVPVPAAVNGVANVSATLLPVVGSLQLSTTTPLVAGQAGSSTLQFTALDADGNAIGGTLPFAVPIQLIPQSPSITFTPNTLTSPASVVTVTYSGAANTNPQITAQAGSQTFTTTLPLAPVGTASPTPAPSPTPTPVVTLSITPGDIGVTVGGPAVPISVDLEGSAGPVLLTDVCSDGASIGLSLTSVPGGTAVMVNVTAVVAPSAAVTHACTITGTAGSLTQSIFVDVNQNTATISSHGHRLP